MSKPYTLTNGFFSSLDELSDKNIEAFFKASIKAGNPSPYYDSKGRAVEDVSGNHLATSFRHTAAINHHIGVHAGRIIDTFNDCADLPFAYWMSGEVSLISRDGYALFGMRSNVTKNAPGICVHASGGFTKMKTPTVSEAALDCQKRELNEETGLTFENITENTINLGIYENWPVSKFDFDMDGVIKTGLAPVHAHVAAVQSHFTAEELARQITVEHETLGFVVAKVHDFEKILRGGCIEAPFWPSPQIHDLGLPRSFWQDGLMMSDIRARLSKSSTPVLAKNGKNKLQNPFLLNVVSDDFTYDGNTQPMEKLMDGAERLNITGRHRASGPKL